MGFIVPDFPWGGIKKKEFLDRGGGGSDKNCNSPSGIQSINLCQLVTVSQLVFRVWNIYFLSIQMGYQDSKFSIPLWESSIPLLDTCYRYHKHYILSHPNKFPWLFTFTWKFRWFHTESKWNKHISTVQPELFRNERFVWKGCTPLPIGTFQPVNFVPFTSFLFFHQFQALLDLTIGIIKYFSAFRSVNLNGKRIIQMGFSIRNFAYH
jgi:hypothetical protein